MKKLNLILILGLMLVVFLIWQWPDRKLFLSFCDVGQGDAILISQGFKQILVDGGPDTSVLVCLGKVMPFWDRKIELVVLTHPDADHLTGLIEVVKRYEVGQLAGMEITNQTPEYEALADGVAKQKVRLVFVRAGDQIKVGQIRLKVIYPDQTKSIRGSTNELATVIEGEFGAFNWLLTSDITEAEEAELRLLGRLEPVEVLKVAHHGSKYSSSEAFLKEVRPRLAVISVGKNSFGHPTEEVLERLKQAWVKVLRTDQQGLIQVVSNGQTWQVKK
ncbi:MAG: ComEC/Rec2 family competence protein [Candidatus Beckwithbacteria bacterium]